MRPSESRSPANRSPTNRRPANHPPMLYNSPPNLYAADGGWPALHAPSRSPQDVPRSPSPPFPPQPDTPNRPLSPGERFDKEWRDELKVRIKEIYKYHTLFDTHSKAGDHLKASHAKLDWEWEVSALTGWLSIKIGDNSADRIEDLIYHTRNWPKRLVARNSPVPDIETEHRYPASDDPEPTRGRSRVVRPVPYTIPPARRPQRPLPEPISPLANRRSHAQDHAPSRLPHRRAATRETRQPTPIRITIPGYLNGGTGNSRPASRDPTPAPSRPRLGACRRGTSSGGGLDVGGGSSLRPKKRKYDSEDEDEDEDDDENEDDTSVRAVRSSPSANRPVNPMPSHSRVVESFTAAVSEATLRDQEIKARQARFAAEAARAREAASQSRIADRLPRRGVEVKRENSGSDVVVKRERSSSAASSPTESGSPPAASSSRTPLAQSDDVVVKTEPVSSVERVVKREPVSPVERASPEPLPQPKAKRARKARPTDSEARATPTRTLPPRDGRGQRRPTPIDNMYITY